MLNSLRGNAETVQSLQAALAGGRLSHAVLLSGPNGCGRGFAARCLAADYLFPNGGPGAAAVMAGESSEVLLVQGEGKSGNIPVERVREIRSAIFHSSLSAAGRVVLVRDAHRMAPPAYNALLKVLEEPPADALFILTTHDSAAIPETIRSRCALYPLAPVSVEACAAQLEKQTPAGHAQGHSPALLAAVYGGRIGAGLAVLRDAGRGETLSNALSLCHALEKRQHYAVLQLLVKYEGRADGERERREALLADVSDILAACLRGTAAKGLPKIPPARAAALLPPVHGARTALGRNGAPKTTFTALGIELARAETAPAAPARA